MIRVLHFASVINRYDIIDSVLTRLDRSQFEPRALTVVPPANRTGTYSKNEEYQSRCMHTDFKRTNYRHIFSELRKDIKEFRPHILQAHHYDECIMGALVTKIDKIPAYVIGHHYSKVIYVLSKGLRRQAYLKIEKWCNDVADRVVVPSQEVFDLLIEQGNSTEKIIKIPFGVELKMLDTVRTEEISALRESYDLKNKFVALVCSRLNKEKGLEYLFRAVPEIKARYPFFRLVVAGAGGIEDELRTLVHELKIDDIVQFVGWRTDAMNWYALSDVVVQPSLTESFCQSLTEAVALKKPVIMTPVGAAPEVIVNGERGGKLVPIGSSQAIFEALCEFIENPELGRRLGEAGRKYIEDNMTFDKTASQNEELYRQIIKNKNISLEV